MFIVGAVESGPLKDDSGPAAYAPVQRLLTAFRTNLGGLRRHGVKYFYDLITGFAMVFVSRHFLRF